MTKTLEATGKTIDEAIAAGLQELGLSRDDVSVEVLEAPAKGFLGFGATNARVSLSYEINEGGSAEEFLKDIFDKMHAKVSMEITQEENEMKIILSGDDIGMIIGRRGETLDALQYLTSLIVNKGKEEYTRVCLDTENYRQKREETLTRLAKKLAGKVQKYHKNITLEPMNPYERRIIHSALQGVEGITTYSVGADPNRKVVIAVDGPQRQGRSRRYHNHTQNSEQ